MKSRTLRRMLAAAVVPMLAIGSGGAANAQEPGLPRELDTLRQAATLEAAGRYAEAEALVAQVLASNPASLTALLQMERVLLVQGRAEALIPLVDGLLVSDPGSAVAHQIKARALSLLDRSEALHAAGEAWIAATPGLEVPYRELARLWQQRGEEGRAIALLERGRRSVARDDALALELGEAYAAANRSGDAAAAWARAIGPQARGLHAVERRLRLLPDGGASVLPRLVAALDREDASIAQLRAATMLAIDAGLADRANHAASRAESRLDPTARRAFLTEIARRADGAGVQAVAYHAYGELSALAAETEGQHWAIRARLADLALSRGDTVRALQLYAEMEKAFATGSAERREAMATRVRIAAVEGEPRAARAALEEFRTEFPDAPETDRLVAAVSSALLKADDVAGAEIVLGTTRGPASARVRGWLAIRRGDLDRARMQLLTAAAGLHGEEGTQAIGLAVILDRVSPRGGELVAELLAAGSPDAAALGGMVEHTAALPDSERAAILDFAAGIAQAAGRIDQADEIRRIIVDEHATSPEAPGALLALARGLTTRTEQGEQARVLLEKLIVDYPRSALVPQARRELERLVASSAPR